MHSINIDLYPEANPIVSDAYDRIIARIHRLNKVSGFQLFTVTGCEPDVGTTTIAVSIAAALAASGYLTLLIDADVRKLADRKRLSADTSHGLTEVVTGACDLYEATCETNIRNLYYLPCGNAAENPVSILNSESMNRFVSFVCADYEYAIFDSSALNTTIDAALISSRTSGTILVAGYMKTKRAKIDAAARELVQTGGNIIGIVLNKVDKKDYKRYIENYDYFIRKKKRKAARGTS